MDPGDQHWGTPRDVRVISAVSGKGECRPLHRSGAGTDDPSRSVTAGSAMQGGGGRGLRRPLVRPAGGDGDPQSVAQEQLVGGAGFCVQRQELTCW